MWIFDLHCPWGEEIVEDAPAARCSGVLCEFIILKANLFFQFAGLHFLLCGFRVLGFDVFGCVDLLFCHGDGDWWSVEGAEAVGDLLD